MKGTMQMIQNRFYLLAFTIYLLLSFQSSAQFVPGTDYYGTNNYVEYHAGNLPIIISAPHGGYLSPSSIPDRSCTGCVTGRDGQTEELAYLIDSAVRIVFGGYPHIIINKLSRIKLDANREIGQAALGNAAAETAWYEYHDYIQAAKDSCIAHYGSAIYIDLHAHGHTKQRIELGYLISKIELQLTDAVLNASNYQDSSSVKHLKNGLNPTTSFSSILRGSDCMGELLNNRGFPSVPSASDPAPLPTDAYFSGGYNTARHGSRDSSQINGIQFETNYTGIRNSNINRKAFASGLACVIKSYLNQWYFAVDNWDPGHVVSTTADSGPGSLRSALLGVQDGDVITFDPSLQGDTIRLKNELQVCSNITIQGPGANLLTVSGEDGSRILKIIQGNSVVVSGLRFSNGRSPAGEDGGAIWSQGILKLSNCILTNNFAQDDGGAISVDDSTSLVQLDSCIVQNNSCGDDGGALRCLAGTLVINASTIKNNSSPSFGGAISTNGIITINQSTLSGNSANSGGGAIRSFGGGSITCTNSTFSGNSSAYRGGAISTASQMSFNFCTLVNNVANDLGGGIRIASGGVCKFKNTLIANNSGSGGKDVSVFLGSIISDGYNLIADTTGSSWVSGNQDQLGNSAAPINPFVTILSSNGGPTETIALQPASPCLDNAHSVGAPIYDQRGNSRITGSSADIGAFEFCIATTSTDVRTECQAFVWIDGLTYSSDNDTATFLMKNIAGCDSIVTLDLTIIPIDTSVSQLGNAFTANLSNATYQWLDCQNGMAILPGETNQNFIPLSNGLYALAVGQNGCTDTSSCFAVSSIGLLMSDFSSEIRVYPNPTNGRLKIDLGVVFQKVDIKLRNAIGQSVSTEEYKGSQIIELIIEGPKGFYTLEISTENGKRASYKVLKE